MRNLESKYNYEIKEGFKNCAFAMHYFMWCYSSNYVYKAFVY